jgi:DNA polymerase-3 subunit epsilon
MIGLFKKRSYEIPKEMLELQITEGRYVVMDTELTGLDPNKDSIVSIGAVKMIGVRIEIGNSYYRVMEPATELKGKSIVIHGITPSEAAECPTIDRLLPEFLDYCKKHIVVGHFLSLDLRFLNKDIKRLFGRYLENPVVDTYKIYNWIRYHDEGFSRHFGTDNDDSDLFSLAKKYRIQVTETHNALTDAFITAQLFQRFLRHLPELGIKTIKGLLRIGSP